MMMGLGCNTHYATEDVTVKLATLTLYLARNDDIRLYPLLCEHCIHYWASMGSV